MLPLLVLFAACTTYTPKPKSSPGAEGAAVAVQRFLQLATQKDYVEMGYVFGTAEGPIMRRDPASDVERRMYALASVLQHEAFVVRGESPVPGRVGNAVELDVRLTQRGQEYVVPFTVVRGPQQRWFVERIGLETITGSTGS